MKKQEILMVLALICSSYPNIKDNEEKIKAMANVWYEFFKNDDADKVLMAVRKHIEQSKFIPTVADIRELMTEKPRLTAFSDNDYTDTDRMERISRGITDEKHKILCETKDYPKEEREKILKEEISKNE